MAILFGANKIYDEKRSLCFPLDHNSFSLRPLSIFAGKLSSCLAE